MEMKIRPLFYFSSEKLFSLPIRDGNLCEYIGEQVGSILFSLPIRDGNILGTVMARVEDYLFSLPIRDGNFRLGEGFSSAKLTFQPTYKGWKYLFLKTKKE